MNSGVGIAVVAIVTSVTVPIVAIIADYRRRKLQYEERRLMIERGMTPPPLQAEEPPHRLPEERRARTLHNGITLVCVGIGLALGAWLLGYVLADTYIPRGIVGPMALGACITGCVGIGKLLYYAVAGKRGAEREPG